MIRIPPMNAVDPQEDADEAKIREWFRGHLKEPERIPGKWHNAHVRLWIAQMERSGVPMSMEQDSAYICCFEGVPCGCSLCEANLGSFLKKEAVR